MQDWHIHDFVSHDATGHVDDFARSALEKGVDIIAFANHPEKMNAGQTDFEIDINAVIENLKIEKEGL